MFRRVIPILLISKNKLIKTYKFKSRYYVGDPLNAVKVFNEKYVDEIAIIDIDTDKHGINYDLIDNLVSEAFIPVSYGGGVSSTEQAKKIISYGVEKISINSRSQDLEFIKNLSYEIGSQSIVVSLDFKKSFFGDYNLIIKKKKITSLSKMKNFFSSLENLCGEILINSVDRDGTRLGYDKNLFEKVKNLTDCPIIFTGGASSINNIEELLDLGSHACGVGRLFAFKNTFDSVLISYNKPEKYNFI